MKLYAFQPSGHGPLSFFVCAESLDEARAAVSAEKRRLIANGGSYEADGDPYEITVYQPGTVASNAND